VARYDSGLSAHKREAAGPFSEHHPRTRILGQQGIPDPFPDAGSKPEAAAKSQAAASRHSHARYDQGGKLMAVEHY
jgi:hypothetical protein